MLPYFGWRNPTRYKRTAIATRKFKNSIIANTTTTAMIVDRKSDQIPCFLWLGDGLWDGLWYGLGDGLRPDLRDEFLTPPEFDAISSRAVALFLWAICKTRKKLISAGTRRFIFKTEIYAAFSFSLTL